MTSPRLDQALVALGLSESRTKAQRRIAAGDVLVNGVVEIKPSQRVAESDTLDIEGGADYVGRGALKMEAALSKWPISPVGKLCVDIGASTGGFTEVLLSRGARHVIALDVGHGQLHPSLDADLRVTRCDGVNIRDVNRQWWDGVSGEAPELIVVDVSFVSLTHVFPPAVALWPEAEWIALVKPQFEVGRTQITGGIAENPDDHEHAVQAVLEHARGLGLNVRGVMASPVTGEAGNREYLCWLSPTAEENPPEWGQEIHRLTHP